MSRLSNYYAAIKIAVCVWTVIQAAGLSSVANTWKMIKATRTMAAFGENTMKKALLASMVFMAVLVTTCEADTRYVALGGNNTSPYTNWTMAARSLASAIIADGDTIIVSNGVYQPASAITLGKDVTITSLYGAAQTVFNGGGQAINGLTSGKNATVYGLTFTNFFGRCIGMYGPTKLTLVNCNISYNRGAQGGGIAMTGGSNAFLYVTNCTIRGNTGTGTTSGGGIYFYSAYGSTCTCRVDNCMISGNSNTEVASAGGVMIRSGSCDAIIKNCLIANNSGDSSSVGGVSGATNINSTVAGNWGGSGGVRYGDNINCIVYFNTNSSGGGANYANATFSYSCTTPKPTGTGNTNADPQFVDSAAGNYRLLKGSPCINTGSNDYSWMNGAVDLGGHTRIVDGTVDMGAYEYYPKVTLIMIQ